MFLNFFNDSIKEEVSKKQIRKEKVYRFHYTNEYDELKLEEATKGADCTVESKDEGWICPETDISKKDAMNLVHYRIPIRTSFINVLQLS